MKIITILLLLELLFIFSSCATQPLNTQAMIGMSWSNCRKEYKLDKYKSWTKPNPPLDGKYIELTYFMPEGNLLIHIDNQDNISFATFDKSEKTPDERINQVYKSWGAYVKKKTKNKKSNEVTPLDQNSAPRKSGK